MGLSVIGRKKGCQDGHLDIHSTAMLNFNLAHIKFTWDRIMAYPMVLLYYLWFLLSTQNVLYFLFHTICVIYYFGTKLGCENFNFTFSVPVY